MASALLAAVLLALGLSLSASVVVARSSTTRLLAQQAAARVVEGARALPVAQAWSALWADPTVEVAGGAVVEDAAGVLRAARAEVLDPAAARGQLAPVAGRPLIALRLLSEAEHAALWGGPIDLDLDGAVSGALAGPGTGAPAPAYAFLSLVVEVRWRDEAGEHRHLLPAVVSHEAPLDPDR